MTENPKDDSANNKRREDADKECIGLLKHISVVSLAAMAFIGGGYVDEKAAAWALKFAAFCFLAAVLFSMVALLVVVANLSVPRNSRDFLSGGEYPLYRVSFILALLFMILGSVILGIVILCA